MEKRNKSTAHEMKSLEQKMSRWAKNAELATTRRITAQDRLLPQEWIISPHENVKPLAN